MFFKKPSLLAQTGFQTTFWDFWTCTNVCVSPVGFQTTFWDFGHVQNLFVSPVGFQTTFWIFCHLKVSFGEIIKIVKIIVLFQHGKDAHRDSAKGALDDSSRTLIWHFCVQIVFLKIGEKCQKY